MSLHPSRPGESTEREAALGFRRRVGRKRQRLGPEGQPGGATTRAILTASMVRAQIYATTHASGLVAVR